MDNPFLNKKTGKIEFPYAPLRDILFIWPEALPEKIGSIFIPEYIRANHANSAGVVLAAGKGHHSKKYKRFIPTTVRVGENVIFDMGIPWSLKVEASDGNFYEVRYMAECDLVGIVREVV